MQKIHNVFILCAAVFLGSFALVVDTGNLLSALLFQVLPFVLAVGLFLPWLARMMLDNRDE